MVQTEQGRLSGRSPLEGSLAWGVEAPWQGRGWPASACPAARGKAREGGTLNQLVLAAWAHVDRHSYHAQVHTRAYRMHTHIIHHTCTGPSRAPLPASGPPPWAASSPRGRKVRESHSTQTPLPGENGPGCPEAGPEALPWPYNGRCLLSRPLAYLRHPSLRAPSLLTLPPSCFLGSRPAALTQACSPARGRPGSRASLQPCCCSGSLLTIPFHPPFFNSRQK